LDLWTVPEIDVPGKPEIVDLDSNLARFLRIGLSAGMSFAHAQPA
jgi:hypothetical protein